MNERLHSGLRTFTSYFLAVLIVVLVVGMAVVTVLMMLNGV